MPCLIDSGCYDNTDYKALKKLTLLLCSAYRALERQNYDFEENPLLSEWWDNHKKEDERRVDKEIKRRLEKEIAKEISQKRFCDLTKEEKQILKEHNLLDYLSFWSPIETAPHNTRIMLYLEGDIVSGHYSPGYKRWIFPWSEIHSLAVPSHWHEIIEPL